MLICGKKIRQVTVHLNTSTVDVHFFRHVRYIEVTGSYVDAQPVPLQKNAILNPTPHHHSTPTAEHLSFLYPQWGHGRIPTETYRGLLQPLLLPNLSCKQTPTNLVHLDFQFQSVHHAVPQRFTVVFWSSSDCGQPCEDLAPLQEWKLPYNIEEFLT